MRITDALAKVVEGRHPDVVGVVGGGGVRDLDHRSAGAARQRRQRMMTREQRGVDREAQQSQASSAPITSPDDQGGAIETTDRHETCSPSVPASGPATNSTDRPAPSLRSPPTLPRNQLAGMNRARIGSV
jgi:hypothetical protein